MHRIALIRIFLPARILFNRFFHCQTWQINSVFIFPFHPENTTGHVSKFRTNASALHLLRGIRSFKKLFISSDNINKKKAFHFHAEILKIKPYKKSGDFLKNGEDVIAGLLFMPDSPAPLPYPRFFILFEAVYSG
jgi:hypothetical protein